MIERRLTLQDILARSLAVGIGVLLGGYLLLTSTVTLVESLWQYDVKRILELCLLPLIFTPVLCNRRLRAGFQQQLGQIPGWLAAALISILTLGIASSLHNSNSSMSLIYSLSEVSILALLVVAGLCVAVCRRAAAPVFDQAAILMLAMVAVAVGLQELLGVAAAWNSGMEFHPRIALLHFSWPRFYNQMQTWSMPAIAALPLVFPGHALARLLCVTALALEWYVVVATGGRGTMVGVGFAVLATLIFLPGIRKTAARYHLAGLIGGLLIYALVVIGHRHLPHVERPAFIPPARAATAERNGRNDGANDAAIEAIGESSGHFAEPMTGSRMWTSSGRWPMWRDSMREAQSHPLLGIGPLNFACTGPVNRAAHPHNFPLQFAAEWGIPAFLLLLLVVIYLWIRLLRALRNQRISALSQAQTAGFLATALLAASVHACLSGVLVMPASQVTGVLVSGWLLGSLPFQPENNGPKSSGPTVLIACLALSAALLLFARHEMAVADARLAQTAMLDQGIPRLWQNGKVCRLYREKVKNTLPVR